MATVYRFYNENTRTESTSDAETTLLWTTLNIGGGLAGFPVSSVMDFIEVDCWDVVSVIEITNEGRESLATATVQRTRQNKLVFKTTSK